MIFAGGTLCDLPVKFMATEKKSKSYPYLVLQLSSPPPIFLTLLSLISLRLPPLEGRQRRRRRRGRRRGRASASARPDGRCGSPPSHVPQLYPPWPVGTTTTPMMTLPASEEGRGGGGATRGEGPSLSSPTVLLLRARL